MYVETEYVEKQLLFHAFAPRLMGTRFDLLTMGQSREEAADLWEDIARKLQSWDKMLNRFDPESELSLYNAGQCGMSPELERLTQIAGKYKVRTAGLFDIGARAGAGLDFGGFAKGLSLQFIKSRLEQEHVTQAFVDFGNSSVLALGQHPLGGLWQLQLTSPYDRSTLHTVSLADGEALSVSGNSPSYEGHIINPLDGSAVLDRKLAVVISRNPLDAEVLSTALMIADKGQRELLEKEFSDARMSVHYI